MKKQHCIWKILLSLTLLITISSCKKEPINSTVRTDSLRPGNSSQPLITRYEYAVNVYTLFGYNHAGQVAAVTDINDIARSDYTITYKKNGKVDRINLGNGYWKFNYNKNNLLAKADAYTYTNGNAVSHGYYQFVYSGQKVIQFLSYSDYGTNVIEPRSKIDLQYDAYGDITRSDAYLWDITEGKYHSSGYQLYQNDTHPNPVYPFRDIFMVLYHVVGPHNFTKAESFDAYGYVDQNNVFEFTYDSLGYPVAAVRRNLAAGPNGFVTLKFVY